VPCRNRGCLARCGARGRCGSLTPGAVWTVRCYLRALRAVRAVPAALFGRSPRGSRHPCRIWPPPPPQWGHLRRPPPPMAARVEPHGLRCAFSRSCCPSAGASHRLACAQAQNEGTQKPRHVRGLFPFLSRVLPLPLHISSRAGKAPDARAARPDARTREPACPRYEPTYTNV
jgi:hypothetical protein